MRIGSLQVSRSAFSRVCYYSERLARVTCGLLVVLLLPLLLGACGSEERVTGYKVGSADALRNPTPTLPPVMLPEDEAPHDNLTEWWYYTGHLSSGERRYGFELVVFQGIRGDLPRSYASHFAITDVQRKSFQYDQKVYTGQQPAIQEGFDLRLDDWRMSGLNGRDRLKAGLPGYSVDLKLTSVKPVVLHDGDGIVSLGASGDSYYYSRTRMAVTGVLEDHGKRLPVTGQAWMDHQWGNFISVAGGGWDWYSVQLEDGADLTVSVVRDLEGREVLRHGTYVEPDGGTLHLPADAVAVRTEGTWTSPTTGITYPMRHKIQLPSQELDLLVTPVLENQELDTRESTGVPYWEGAMDVVGARDGKPVRGQGYVELTGYGEGSP